MRNCVHGSLGSGYRVINCSGVDLQTSENNEIIQNLVKNVKNVRGEFISNTIDINFCLDELIGLFLFGGCDKNKLETFNELLLKTEFFSLSKKKGLLVSLLKKYPQEVHGISEDQRLGISSIFETIIKFRNAFAHGVIVVDFKNKTTYIYPISTSKKKIRYPINSDTLERLQSHIDAITQFSFFLIIKLSQFSNLTDPNMKKNTT